MLALIDESIAELKPSQPAAPAPKASPPPPRAPESRPAPEPAPAEAPEEEPPVPYQVNDEVLAKWMSGDKKFWPARITSVTGSSSSPIYLVKFKSYKGTETLRARDIRPASNKRKAEAPPAPPASDHLAAAPPPPPPAGAAGGDGTVLSAAASRYPEALGEEAQAKPPKPKKIKATRELEAGKSKWQEFNAKGKGGKSKSKGIKKDSMFRTPDSIHGRGKAPTVPPFILLWFLWGAFSRVRSQMLTFIVGFTGSGQAMRKDPTRSRHIYQPNDDLD